jgi:hypothetical protein
VIVFLGTAFPDAPSHAFKYLLWASLAALAWCIVVALPLLLFRATRAVSVYSFNIASLVLGLTTWIYGFTAAYAYWGVLGLSIGLFLGVVGVVPIGLIAGIYNGGWDVVIGLVLGMLFTYCARLTARRVQDAEEKRRMALG